MHGGPLPPRKVQSKVRALGEPALRCLPVSRDKGGGVSGRFPRGPACGFIKGCMTLGFLQQRAWRGG